MLVLRAALRRRWAADLPRPAPVRGGARPHCAGASNAGRRGNWMRVLFLLARSSLPLSLSRSRSTSFYFRLFYFIYIFLLATAATTDRKNKIMKKGDVCSKCEGGREREEKGVV